MQKKEMKLPILEEELKRMAQTDVRTVDRDTLVDIDDVKIDTSLPVDERIADYIRQIKNPYCHICNGMIVKVSFSGKERLEDCLARCLSM